MMMGLPEIVFGFFSMILVVGFWAMVIVVVTRLVRGHNTPSPSSGVRILEERYARGEISEDEFLERRAVLEGKS